MTTEVVAAAVLLALEGEFEVETIRHPIPKGAKPAEPMFTIEAKKGKKRWKLFLSQCE